MHFLKRTWAEINLDHLIHNFQAIRGLTAPTAKIMAVVKADGYGHGDHFVAPLLQQAGADWFGVSNIEEASALRAGGITKPILIFGTTPPSYVKELCDLSITQAVFCEEYAVQLNTAAAEIGVTVDCHLKIDTGMARIGFSCRESDDIGAACAQIERCCRELNNLNFTGIFTHFAVEDEPTVESDRFSKMQFAHFQAIVQRLHEVGITFAVQHCCNSAGVLRSPEMHLDLVRPGIILYGLNPSSQCGCPQLKPAMELKTVVAMLKTVPAHTSVGYGRTFVTDRDTVIATLPVGYADGYPRLLSNCGSVLIHGKHAPILGRVCMDQIMVDVTDIPDVRTGDIVTLFGADGDAFLSVDELSRLAGTVNYETICIIGKRVPRVFLKNGTPIGVTDLYALANRSAADFETK